MSTSYDFLEPQGFHMVTACEPFDLDELYTLAKSVLQKGLPGHELWRPTLIDLRKVDYSIVEFSRIRRILIQRKALGEAVSGNPTAFVVKDIPSFVKVRFQTNMAELIGLRKEESSFITMDLAEALTWLEQSARKHSEPHYQL